MTVNVHALCARGIVLGGIMLASACANLTGKGPFEDTPHVALPIESTVAQQSGDDGRRTTAAGEASAQPARPAERPDIGFIRPGTGVFTRPGRTAKPNTYSRYQ